MEHLISLHDVQYDMIFVILPYPNTFWSDDGGHRSIHIDCKVSKCVEKQIKHFAASGEQLLQFALHKPHFVVK